MKGSGSESRYSRCFEALSHYIRVLRRCHGLVGDCVELVLERVDVELGSLKLHLQHLLLVAAHKPHSKFLSAANSHARGVLQSRISTVSRGAHPPGCILFAWLVKFLSPVEEYVSFCRGRRPPLLLCSRACRRQRGRRSAPEFKLSMPRASLPNLLSLFPREFFTVCGAEAALVFLTLHLP